MFRKLTDDIWVAPQIDAAAVAEAARQGITMIVNNRPDGEGPEDPQGPEIEAAAVAAGLGYVAIPITHSGFSQPQVEAMVAALETSPGPVLAYCRSGTRSTLLWALAESSQGGDADTLTAIAAGAGYDVAPVRPLMDMLKAQA